MDARLLKKINIINVHIIEKLINIINVHYKLWFHEYLHYGMFWFHFATHKEACMGNNNPLLAYKLIVVVSDHHSLWYMVHLYYGMLVSLLHFVRRFAYTITMHNKSYYNITLL